MKKRLISFLLVTGLLVSLLPMSASAATETVDGTQYTTVSTASQLYSALSSGGNILLQNDIALNSSFSGAVTIRPGTVLNGNGYSITYSGSRSSALFKYAAGSSVGNATSYIKNIGFGTSTVPMTLTGSASLFAEASVDTCEIIYQNVDF